MMPVFIVCNSFFVYLPQSARVTLLPIWNTSARIQIADRHFIDRHCANLVPHTRRIRAASRGEFMLGCEPPAVCAVSNGALEGVRHVERQYPAVVGER
jgi:hypothetical protein